MSRVEKTLNESQTRKLFEGISAFFRGIGTLISGFTTEEGIENNNIKEQPESATIKKLIEELEDNNTTTKKGLKNIIVNEEKLQPINKVQSKKKEMNLESLLEQEK